MATLMTWYSIQHSTIGDSRHVIGMMKSEQQFIKSHAMPQHEKLRLDTEGLTSNREQIARPIGIPGKKKVPEKKTPCSRTIQSDSY
jgi:hypothetical protein